MNKILNWFVRSSVNPEEVSMTVKGLLLIGGGQVIDSLSSLGISISKDVYQHDVAITATVLGLILSVVGMVRKVVLTAKA